MISMGGQTLLDLFDPENRALEVLLSGSAAPAGDGVALRSWAQVRQVLIRSRDEQLRLRVPGWSRSSRTRPR